MTTVSCDAILLDIGRGILELANNTLIFTMEKGFFKKRREIIREIHLNDIKKVELRENQLSITWLLKEDEEVTDIFIVEETESLQRIHRTITDMAKEQKKVSAAKEEAKQKSEEIKRILKVALEIVDSLFGILKNLHGRIDWNNIENHLIHSKENIENFKSQIISTVNLDLTKLSLVIKERLVEETAKEVYNILSSLYEYFVGLASKKDEFLEQVHPNFQDAKTAIFTYYSLNDIVLGIIVGDEEIKEENKKLEMMLDELSTKSYFEINSKMLKDAVNKLINEVEKQDIIEEIRTMFKQPLTKSAS